MVKEKSKLEDKYRCKIIVKPGNHILKNKIITDRETSEIKENIILHHIREEESNNNLGTNEEHLDNKKRKYRAAYG
jgi:hypothetical protein